jgi:flagellar hook-length control protein FliK
MKGNSPPEDEQGTQSDSEADAAARAEATVQAQQPPLQPELAALLGGLILPAALPATDLPTDAEGSPATSEDDAATLLSNMATDERHASGLFATHTSLPPEAATRATSGNGDLQTAESAARNPASFAASPGKGEDASLHGAPPALADTPLRAAEPPVAATPTNSFAAIHAAALANLQGAAPPPAPAPVPMHVATPAGSPGWPEEVGNRVSWMVGQTESHAELTLTPPQLGKVEVSITVSGDQTSAQFVAATPAARELIEQSLPRLREILEQSGISLGQTDVGTSGQPGDPERSPRGSQWRGGSGNTTRDLQQAQCRPNGPGAAKVW